MSDPTAIQVPPTPPVVTSRGGSDVRVPAQVISDPQQVLPPQTDAPQRVRAEVVARTDDGAVRVQVNGGEIELRPAPPRQTQAQAQQTTNETPRENTPRQQASTAEVRAETPRTDTPAPPRSETRAQPQQTQPQRQQTTNEAPRESRQPPAAVQISSAAVGRQIEIEIPAQTQTQTQQSAAARAEQVILRLEAALVQNTQSQQTQTVARTTATPVQVSVTDNAALAPPQVSINVQTGLPEAEEIIRLQPLSLSDAAAIIRPQISSTQNAALIVSNTNTALPAPTTTPPNVQAVATQAVAAPQAAINAAPLAIPTTPLLGDALQATPLLGIATESAAQNLQSLQTPLTAPTTTPSAASGAEVNNAQLQTIPALISTIPAAIATPQTQGALPQGLASLNIVQTVPATLSVTTLTASAPTTAISAQINNIIPPQISLIAPEGSVTTQRQQAIYEAARAAPENALPHDVRADRASARLEGLTQQGQPVFSVDLAGQAAQGSAFGQAQGTAPLFALDYALTDAARASLQSLPQGLQAELSLAQPLPPNGALQTATTLQASLAAPSTLPPITSFLTAELWPAANTLYQNIAQVSAQAASAFAAMTPSPANAAQFGPAVMFFVAAMRSGDISGWLGNKSIDALQRSGKTQSLSKFMSDGAGMIRLAAEPAVNDWRAMSIPLMYGERIEKVALYYKQDDGAQDDESGENKGGFNRFIFNLSPNNMGKVQLDGLYRGGIGKGRLDLALRTEAPFSQAMKMEMRRIYVDALESAGVSGELSFQNNPESWVTITPEKQGFGASA